MISLKDSYWQPIHREIQNFLWLQIFDPLFTLLSIKKPFQNAQTSRLQEAISEGRVFYHDGVFTGTFDIRTSKELSEFATYNPRSHSWVGAAPPEIVAEQARVAFENKRINDRIRELLPKFDASFEQAVKALGFPIMHVIDSLNGDIQGSLQSLAILPELTEEAKKNLAEFYNDKQRFNIEKWFPEQIDRLRQTIETNVKAGYNRDELERLISQEWEVSANKARFLARQETSIFVSTFRDQRYQSAGVEEYVWMSSHDSRCREANKYGGPAHGPGGPLHGHVFRFDSPPASGTHGEHENPGIPFGCRCIAKPILKQKLGFGLTYLKTEA